MKKIIYILSIITLTFTFNSCESEISILDVSEDLGFTGSTEDIKDFLGADVYQAMIETGLSINPGSNPSLLEGTFIANPYCRLLNDGTPECFSSSVFWNVTFSNQNNDDLTISYSGYLINIDTGETNSEESGTGKITGDSSGNFTVLVNAVNSDGTNTSTAFSGQIFTEGINEYQDIFVQDTNASELVTQLFYDQDGLAERQ